MDAELDPRNQPWVITITYLGEDKAVGTVGAAIAAKEGKTLEEAMLQAMAMMDNDPSILGVYVRRGTDTFQTAIRQLADRKAGAVRSVKMTDNRD